MTREQLEHIIRAACTIADDTDVIVIGSQAVLGQYPSAPAELLVSIEADVYPRNHPERAELIEGAIGELSMFHETFGYYADGVAPETATLPTGWEGRLFAIRNAGTLGNTGWTLEIHDLLISKYVANREKDRDYIRVALANRLAEPEILRQRLATTELAPAVRERIERQIEASR